LIRINNSGRPPAEAPEFDPIYFPEVRHLSVLAVGTVKRLFGFLDVEALAMETCRAAFTADEAST